MGTNGRAGPLTVLRKWVRRSSTVCGGVQPPLNLLTVFDELLHNEAFTDVTLVCDGRRPHQVPQDGAGRLFPLPEPLHRSPVQAPCGGEVNVAAGPARRAPQDSGGAQVKGLVEENRSNRTPKDLEPMEHSPSITTSNSVMQGAVHSSSNSSPPHSTNSIHPHAAATAAAAMLTGCYEAASSDMSPLKRKKLSSLLMNRDTPILRTVLGQGQADSSQPVSLVCHSDSAEHSSSNEERIKTPNPPYTDFTPMNDEEDKSKLAVPSSSPQSFGHEIRGVSSGIATYVPTQKPEWKRYKQYTRNDIMSAIEAVRNGMSALQAARKYGVPSRTLYDKVKKLGITTSRPFKRGSNGSSACFPYGTGSPYGGHLSETEEGPINNNSALIDASTFLQHALDGRSGDDREALAAMAAAAAAHAAVSGHSTSPSNHGRARSPSPSPTMLKYMRHASMTPSPAPGSDHHNSHSETNGSSERDHEEEEDQVEDLSVGRKESRESRVIMPPMNQVSTIMKKEEMLIDVIKEEARREVSVEGDSDL
ncbi:hypothetical protein NQ318_010209, partial [Aromia moschata]